MTENIHPQPGIMDIAPYVGGASKLQGVADVVKLSSNENLWGPSPRAVAAFVDAASNLQIYPSSDHSALRQAIGEVHGVDPARIICGAGSDEIISFLCNTYAGVGDEVLFTEHGFEMYRIYALAAGATPVSVPEKNRHTDVDALLAGCNDRTRLIFVANPNNPTGTMISAQEITRLADGIPDTALLVLDGAYAEYVPDFDAGARLVEERQNVVMTRTFSKIYGLGSLRIGWGYGPEHVIDALNRVRGPFNVTAAALAAAEAAVRDTEYTAFCRRETARMRQWLADQLAAIGIPSDSAEGNFILVRFADGDEAGAADDHLKSKGLITRRVIGYGFPECLRITIGDPPACERVVQALTEFRAERR